MSVQPNKQSQIRERQTDASKVEIDLKSVTSPALARLIEEVRNKEVLRGGSYDRVYNRHNR